MIFIKRHKTFCIIIVILLALIAVLYGLYKTLSVDVSKSEYGDRLQGISEVKISKEEVTKLKSEMKDLEEVKNCKYRLKGRLIYITLTFNEDVKVKNAKKIAKKLLDYFDDDEKEYYDIQVILENENKKIEGYPKMGYKHKTTKSIVW